MNLVVLNLNRAEERRKNMISQFNNIGLQPTIIEAVDGNLLSDNEKNKFINNPGGWRNGEKFKPGEIGCIRSTINSIELAKKSKWEIVVIMDDDIIISEDFQKGLNFLFRIVPEDWQHIFLGGHIYMHAAPVFQPSVIPTTFKVSGSYCYILKETSYDLVLEELYKIQLPVDDAIEKLYRKDQKIKSYMFFPFLAYPKSDFSYIWNKPADTKNHPSIKYFKNKI